MNKKLVLLIAILVFSVGFLSGCNEKTEEKSEKNLAPIIKFFTSTLTTITYGNSTVLKWSVEGATNVSIDNGIGEVDFNGSLPIFPIENQTYTLTAVNLYGSSNASIKVYVSIDNGQSPEEDLAPIINFFTATPTTVTYGNSTVLKWSVEGATNVSIYYISNEIVYVGSSGSITIFPSESKKYSLIAYNEYGTNYAYIYLEVT